MILLAAPESWWNTPRYPMSWAGALDSSIEKRVHATLAGIFLAFSFHVRPKYDPQRFVAQIKEMVRQIRQAYLPGREYYQER